MRRVIRKPFLAVLCLLLGSGLVAGCSGASTPDRPTATSKPLDQALDEVFATNATYGQVRAILVARDGKLVFQRYQDSTADDYREVASVTKSVVGTLTGIAIAEGKLNLDGELGDLLPDYRREMAPKVRKITLEQVLTMTAGFPDTWDYGSELLGKQDWVRTSLGLADPGETAFAYSDYGSHVLAAIVTEATGEHLLDYARAKLFDPLGVISRPAFEPSARAKTFEQDYKKMMRADFAWPTDPQRVNIGCCALQLRPQDMLSLGQLYLDGGSYRGRQVVPAAWVRASTSKHVDVPAGRASGDGYGYQWWTGTADGDPAFRAYGYGGQLIEVVPKRRLVTVLSTEWDQLDPADQGIGVSAAIDLADAVIVPRFR